MITLCLDSCSGPGSIAIAHDGQTLAESMLAAPAKRQNGWLLPELERLLISCSLTLDRIDLFACTVGPGAFTGIRTGVATVQGLALALEKPCIGLSTLALLAAALPHAAHPVCPLLDARKSEVYAGLYRCGDLPTPLVEERAAAPSPWLEQLNGPTIFTGDGALRYRELITATLGKNALFAPPGHAVPHAGHGILLAEQAFRTGQTLAPEQLLPRYLRLSEAELSRQQKI